MIGTSILMVNLIFNALEVKDIRYTNPSPISFTYEEACRLKIDPKKIQDKLSLTDSSSMIDVLDINTLDCFGKKILVKKFCLERFPNNKRFTDSYIDKVKKKVICQFADQVIAEFNIDLKQIKSSGKTSEKEKEREKIQKNYCLKLKEIYAFNLQMFESSILPEENRLKCHFTAKGFLEGTKILSPLI